IRYEDIDRAVARLPIGARQANLVEQDIKRIVEYQNIVGDIHMIVIVDPFRQDRLFMQARQCGVTHKRTSYSSSSFTRRFACMIRAIIPAGQMVDRKGTQDGGKTSGDRSGYSQAFETARGSLLDRRRGARPARQG